MIWAQLSEPGCTAMVAAARAADFDGPSSPASAVRSSPSSGTDAVDVYTLQNTLQPTTRASAPARSHGRLDEYAQLMDDAGHSTYTEGYATWPFGGLMELRAPSSSRSTVEVNAESVEAAFDRDVDVPAGSASRSTVALPAGRSRAPTAAPALSVYQVGEAGRRPLSVTR